MRTETAEGLVKTAERKGCEKRTRRMRQREEIGISAVKSIESV